MTFQEALEYAGKPSLNISKPVEVKKIPRKTQQPQIWHKKAARLIENAHKTLLADKSVLKWLWSERGITEETAKRFHLGWIEQAQYPDKESWGLEPDGKKLFNPSGLTIPWKDRRLRIRRDNPGEYGRYHILAGSSNEFYTIGTPFETTAIVVESELDAILLAQEIKRKVFIVATGSTSNKPKSELIEKLSLCPVVLVAFDTDPTGAKTSKSWLESLPNAYRTLTPSRFGKDPAEAFLDGLDINDWLAASMELYVESIALCEESKFIH